MNRNKIETI